MTDRMLYLALAVSVFGLLLIAFISPSIRPPLSKVSDVGASSLERVVRVEGNVSQIHTFKGGSMLLTLAEGGRTLDAYLLPAVASNFNDSVKVGSTAGVMGTVQLYDGRLEVVVDDVSGMWLR